MGIALPSVAELDPATVAATQAELAALLSEAFPPLDLSRGVLHDVVLHLAAITSAMLRTAADRIAASQSLLAIAADPAAADPAAVDAVLSNFRLTRRAAAAASGQVTVVLDAAVPVVVPAGTAFTAGAAAFATAQAISVRLPGAAATSASDRVLAAIGGGLYAFTVPVTATTAGSAGAIRRGTALEPTFTVPHLARAYAAGDFSGGVDAETNAALVARLAQGVAAATFSGRANVAALLARSGAVDPPLALSIIGAGDPEMARDRHTIFPIAQFGRADVYARTAALPAEVPLAVTATLVAVAAASGTWQFSIPRDAAPGFYAVTRVALPADPPTAAGFAVTDDVRAVDLSPGLGQVPDVAHPAEAAYGAFQTATVRFLDDRTPTAGLAVGTATAPYAVAVTALPGIAALQAFLGGRDTLAYGGDVLVRAPVPCSVSATIDVHVPSQAQALVDASAVAAAAAAWVNASGFPGALRAQGLAVAIQGLLPPGSAVGAVDLAGRVRRPDGTTAFLRDPFGRAIAAPDQPGAAVTGRTVAFFLDPGDVAVAVHPLSLPDL